MTDRDMTIFQMVGGTRSTPGGFAGESSGDQHGPPPPPPPLPNMADVMAAQTELLRQLVQGQQMFYQQQGGRQGHQPQSAGYHDFLGTQPPLFNKTEDPLDADAWIRTIESKFSLLVLACSEANKARFAAQQLRGPARLWWDNYTAMLPADHVVSWDEFKTAFRAHHIPEGLMERKLNEFLALTQGTRTVLQYAQAFNGLCQYAGYHADTDIKKMDRFRRGLNTKLKERLNPVRTANYNELVNLAITQEDCIMAHRADKKRKAPAGPSVAPTQRYRLVQNASPKTLQRAPQPGRWVIRPPQQSGAARPPVSQQNGPRPNFQQQPARPGNANRCFICGSTDHFARECPQARPQSQGQGSGQNNKNKGKRQVVQVRQGRVNFTTLTELPEGAPIMTGTFSIRNKPAVILFDSGASHSFIANRFATRNRFPSVHTRQPFMISTPGGKVASNQLVRQVPL